MFELSNNERSKRVEWVYCSYMLVFEISVILSIIQDCVKQTDENDYQEYIRMRCFPLLSYNKLETQCPG